MKSKNIANENYQKLAALFPNAVTETITGYDDDGNAIIERAIDKDVLMQEIATSVVEGREERYQFTWPDKKKAILAANAPINKTLRPCKEESVDFDNTENLYIEGDNLEVLKLLQETYLGKIKMIYIDPPYNTGNDFVYNDDFSIEFEEYLDKSGQLDEDGNRMVQNTETNGRFHSDWINMVYSRLKLAKNLLTEDGVIFISIDDSEQSNLSKICDEVFGEKNFQGMFIINSSPSAIDYGCMAKMHEYALMYSKNYEKVQTNKLIEEDKQFTYEDEQGPFDIYPLYNGNVAFNPTTRPNLYYPFYLNPNHKFDENFYEIGLEPKDGWEEVWPVVSKKDHISRVWRWGKEEKARKNLNKEIVGYKNKDGEYRIVQKYRSTEKTIRSLLLDNTMSSRRGTAEVQELFGEKVFSFPKPIGLISQFLETGTQKDSIVLDFFSGSAATADSIMRLNAKDQGVRKFILVQLPEEVDSNSIAGKSGYRNICEIGKERIRKAGRLIKEKNPLTTDNLDTGFRVLKCDSSNMENVYYSPTEVNQTSLFAMSENIKPDRSAEDLLFQVMIDLGVLLSSKIEEEVIFGKSVYRVADGFLIACFDADITDQTVTEIAKRKPYYAVFRDIGMATDSVATNFDQIFATYSPNTVRRIL